MSENALLVVPAFGGGRGGGHLVRAVALVEALRAQGREAWISAPDPAPPDMPWVIPEAELSARPWSWIILDRFRTSAGDFARWAALGPLIGIDEGGPFRSRFDFLADLLPLLPGAHPPNFTAPHLNPRPGKRRNPPFAFPADGPLNVLVSFGAEDAAGLTVPAALALACPRPSAPAIPVPAQDGVFPEVTALFGGLNRDRAGRETLARAGLRVEDACLDLRERLADYDLLVTHFGLTAFEALAAGVPVILVSPGRYHERLARQAGFLSTGSGKRAAARLGKWLYAGNALNREALNELSGRCRDCAEKYHSIIIDDIDPDPVSPGRTPHPGAPGSFGGFARWEPLVFMRCPVCGSGDRIADPVLARFPERTYRRCLHCGTVYLNRQSPPPVEYARDYFFDSYKKQYGKTYLEDFPSLKAAGHVRLGFIRRILAGDPGRCGVVNPAEGVAEYRRRRDGAQGSCSQSARAASPSLLRLLDIGCAYGPFLQAAREAGFAPEGVDPAGDAVDWVNRELDIPAYRGFFPDPALREIAGAARFDVVTLWYVIEHFRDPRAVFAEIHRILKPHGVLAFSTPALAGISGRTSRHAFLEHSPGDHFTVWDSRRVRAILHNFGFKVMMIRITGHHPERFPRIGKFMTGNRGPLYRLVFALSRLFALGDTFEVYAVKRGEA
jgi:2-polyprenyl-3-methyl-5-hydroxy-6-metoxy-1,4-benzoquinol methylase